MTVSVSGLPSQIANLIQDNTLERVFHDALFPRLLYRAEAMPELWVANLGERQIFTRAGLIPVTTTALDPGKDPTPEDYEFEQWEAEARQFGKTIDTSMPTSYVSLASLFLRNAVQLGLNAGQTLNRLVRDALYKAYLGGNTVATADALAAATTIQVASLNGFTEVLVDGRPTPVSAANSLPVTIDGVANTVTGAVPDVATQPFGPGTLTIGTPLAAPIAARDSVLATQRSRIVRVGGGTSIDAITAANILTLQDVINAVAQMRENNVPPCSDGYYHVHLSPTGEAQIFQDNQFQRLFQSLPESMAYRDLAIGQLVGCRFYRNTENPTANNSGALLSTGTNAEVSPSLGGEVVNNNDVNIARAIVIGGGAIYEKYLDESKYISEAGVQGKIGNFSIVNNGVQVMTSRIRYILRAPQDRLQQVVSQSWSWSGDFPIPSDFLEGDAARFKRATIIEHAG